MRVFTLETVQIYAEEVPQDRFVDIPEEALPSLAGKVAYYKDGILHVPRHVEDLEAVIAGLSSDDLALQKRLLRSHCAAFDPGAIHNKWKEWEKRATTIKRDKGVSREEAEQEAVEELHLLAFLNERPENMMPQTTRPVFPLLL